MKCKAVIVMKTKRGWIWILLLTVDTFYREDNFRQNRYTINCPGFSLVKYISILKIARYWDSVNTPFKIILSFSTSSKGSSQLFHKQSIALRAYSLRKTLFLCELIELSGSSRQPIKKNLSSAAVYNIKRKFRFIGEHSSERVSLLNFKKGNPYDRSRT